MTSAEVDPTTATSEEILTTVERWARAHPSVQFKDGVTVAPRSGAPWILVIHGGSISITPISEDDAMDVDPATALAWALCVDAGVTVDVGRCRVCSTLHTGKWRREVVYDLLDHPDEWRCFAGRPAMQRAANAMAREGLLVVLSDHANRFKLACCRGLLRDTREAARLVLDAAPRDLGSDAHVYDSEADASDDAEALAKLKKRPLDRYHVRQSDTGWRIHEVEPGDPKAREALAVLAERMVSDGVECEADFFSLDSFGAAEVIGREHIRERGGCNHAVKRRWRLGENDSVGYHAEMTWTEPNPTGLAIAHWLALWTAGDLRETRAAVDTLTAAWERLTVPCGRCEETGVIEGISTTIDCPNCHGYGRVRPWQPVTDAPVGAVVEVLPAGRAVVNMTL